MVTQITSENIGKIKNQLLKADVERYVKIYEGFLQAVEDSGVKISKADFGAKREELIKKITEKGGVVRNNGKSVVLNEISPSCTHCQKGLGSATYILTLACNRDCFFCTNKNQADYEEGVNKIYDVVKDFNRDRGYYKEMKSAALTGGEPLLHPDKCVEFVKKVKKSSKNTQTRIYTNGDLATTEILKQLKDAGLDEIRFGLKPDDSGDVDTKILETIGEATSYIQRVMVEMPVVPGSLEKMKELLVKLDELNIFGINILEFLYPWVNGGEYSGHKYEIAPRPYNVLFGYSYAGGVPVAGSENECLELLLFSAEKKLKMGVHYCSLENKLTAQLYHQNSALTLRGCEFFSPNDFFIKTVKGYSDDIDKIKDVLEKKGCAHYIYNKSAGFIEFSPVFIEHMKDMDMELGLSYQASDYDEEGRRVLRELQIDLVKPASFQLDKI